MEDKKIAEICAHKVMDNLLRFVEMFRDILLCITLYACFTKNLAIIVAMLVSIFLIFLIVVILNALMIQNIKDTILNNSKKTKVGFKV